MILPEKTTLSTVVTHNALQCNGIAAPMPVSVFLKCNRGDLSLQDYQTYNVAVEQQEMHSLLALVHALLAIRRLSPALSVGFQRFLNPEQSHMFRLCARTC